jgi:acylphosphatase
MFRRKFIKATGATMLGGALAGCSGTSSGNTETGGGATETTSGADTTSEDTGTTSDGTGTESDDLGDLDGEILDDDPEGLQVASEELYEEASAVGLRGTVENTGDVPYESVEVEVTLQDDQGEVLYEFIDETEEEQVQTLEAGAEWEFDVVFEEAKMNEVRKYTVELDGDRAQSADDEPVGNETGNGTATGTSMNETTTTSS